jgi:hypothetical protein
MTLMEILFAAFVLKESKYKKEVGFVVGTSLENLHE